MRKREEKDLNWIETGPGGNELKEKNWIYWKGDRKKNET